MLRKNPYLLGSDRPLTYTGEGKGGPDPYEGAVVFQTTLPLLYYLFSLKEHTNIPLTPTLTLINHPMEYKQIKSKWYYIFWSLATICVVCGQLYIASSYKELAAVLQLSLA